MKLLLINSVCGIRSTGRICAEIAREYELRGWSVKIAYGREEYVPEDCKRWAIRIGNTLSVRLHGLFTRIFDWHGTGPCSWFSTKRFIRWADEWRPDVVWLHNIHGYFLNYELLFKWIKRRPEMQVKWTLHSCWPFTGHCGHFDYAKCDKWTTGCMGHCPCKKNYPSSALLSASHSNWMRKKSAFCGVKNMQLISPSKWLADLTRESILKEYPIEVVHNKIDLSAFKPRPSDFRVRNKLLGKYIILGVASTWTDRKGLDDFVRLAAMVDDRVKIVLVGLSKSQIQSCSGNIIGISRTNNAQELAKIYSAVDVFFNPTKEENYPTVNLEAKACGCKIITYDTGGCSETVEGYEKAWILRGVDKSPEGLVNLLVNDRRLGYLAQHLAQEI